MVFDGGKRVLEVSILHLFSLPKTIAHQTCMCTCWITQEQTTLYTRYMDKHGHAYTQTISTCNK